MFNLKSNHTKLLELDWTGKLSEYVTDLVWSSHDYLAATSGAGEVLLWDSQTHKTTLILSPEESKEQSIDCLSFSADAQFLAAAGQAGTVRIWQMIPQLQLINTLGKTGQWIDHLTWHPRENLLAFNWGRYVQIFDISAEKIIVTLPFESSSVLGITWHPGGEYLAIAGNGGIKIWKTHQWNGEPIELEMPAACTAIAWSNEGEYLAASCFDNTVLLWRFGDENPWQMTGFGGKIRRLTWSSIKSGVAPLLAVACQERIIIWKKQKTDEEGWLSRALIFHEDLIKDIAFQPNRLLLASVAEDGQLLLWQKAQQLRQCLQGASAGFSCLSWDHSGQKLAAGRENGELLILTKSKRGQGFG